MAKRATSTKGGGGKRPSTRLKRAPQAVKPARTGRPTAYSEQLADKICQRLASGESLRSISRDDNMPSRVTILNWAGKEDHPFAKKYAWAREIGWWSIADDLLDIADDGSNDWMEKRNAEGELLGWQLNGEAVARSRIRVDARKWMLSKMLPKIYGDKLAHEHTGKNGGPIVHTDAPDRIDLARWIASILTAAEAGTEPVVLQ